jgi:alpha-tubulin suppressor-like RCC1 family protein
VGLGGGESITDIAAGRSHYCVVISTGVVKCWGRNNLGQLGIDSTTNKGDVANTMGSNLTAAISVSSATSLMLMRESSCAKISGGTAKCWGANGNAQLLTGSNNNGGASNIGDSSSEMAAIAQINLGTGLSPVKMAGGQVFACSIQSNNLIKCWGATSCGNKSNSGCLLTGTTTKTDIGNAAGEVGDSLLPVNH